MQLYGRVILGVVVFCSALVSLAATPVLTPPKRVLIFYPERLDTPGHMLFEQHLRSTLGADPTHRIDFCTEHMDISRFSGETYVSALYELYRQKYAGHTMDLIITVTRRPLQFVIQYQHELFPGTPVVFCSIDAETLRGLHLGPPMTGIVRHLDFAGTLDLALRLHPGKTCGGVERHLADRPLLPTNGRTTTRPLPWYGRAGGTRESATR